MSGAIISVRARDQLERVAAAAAHLVPHRVPLYRAAADGLIAMVEPRRDASVPARSLAADRPVILLIGDDDETPTGPTAWRCAQRARKWGRAALVHAAGGEPEHYRAAVVAAAVHRRLVLIETTTAHQELWLAWLRPAVPTMVIATCGSDVHPRPESRVFQ